MNIDKIEESKKANKLKDRNYLTQMYNATSTDDGKGEIETYINWLERQLLSRIEKIEMIENDNFGKVKNKVNAQKL